MKKNTLTVYLLEDELCIIWQCENRPEITIVDFLADRIGSLSVRLFVWLSICLWHCAFWLLGLVYRAKSCTSVFLAGMLLYVPSDTFAVGCVV